MNRPSRANQEAFDRAVDEVTSAAARLVQSITTSAAPRNRDEVRVPKILIASFPEILITCP